MTREGGGQRDEEEERQVARYWGRHGLGSSSPEYRSQVTQGGVGGARMVVLGLLKWAGASACLLHL